MASQHDSLGGTPQAAAPQCRLCCWQGLPDEAWEEMAISKPDMIRSFQEENPSKGSPGAIPCFQSTTRGNFCLVSLAKICLMSAYLHAWA